MPGFNQDPQRLAAMMQAMGQPGVANYVQPPQAPMQQQPAGMGASQPAMPMPPSRMTQQMPPMAPQPAWQAGPGPSQIGGMDPRLTQMRRV